MLLIGMWINFTKNPMNPIIAKPIAVAMAIFSNSRLSGFVHLLTRRAESLANCLAGSRKRLIWSILSCLKSDVDDDLNNLVETNDWLALLISILNIDR